MERTVKILLLEDNTSDAELIRYQISKSSFNSQVKHVSELADFSMAIDQYIPDIILSDYNLVGFTGMDALELVRQKCRLTPFIIVTGTIDEETAADTIKKGAWDYIVKERLMRLNSAIKNALQLKEEKENSAIATKKLKISEERYKLAIEGSQDGIWDWDLNTDAMYFSSRWKSMLGYADDEIEPSLKVWRDLVHPDDNALVFAALDKHLKEATPHYSVEFRLRCKDGGYKWISARNKALFDENGEPYRIAGSHTDISERKLMEIELIKAKEKAEESDRLKSAFLANMSHEIRTPMNGILGFANLLKNPALSGEQQQKYIQIIEKGGERMLNIINNIVSISRIESGQLEINIQDTNINEQIEYIYTFFKPEVEAKGMQLLFRNALTSSRAVLQTDRDKLYGILTNLVKNAIKYSENGTIEFGYTAKENHLEFFVKDNGIGIPEDRKGAIFERFIQADIADKMARQGAGLGLSISKAYVEMLGGCIWVESIEGKGSVFYFTLPYQSEKEEVVKTETVLINEESALEQIKNIKILIAEDDETSEFLISLILEDYASVVLKARTGKEAVDMCRKHPDLELILMDIQMSNMNGYEATRQIRQFNKEVIIIAQTALGLVGDREKAIEAGCNNYITKPIDKESLLTLIQETINIK